MCTYCSSLHAPLVEIVRRLDAIERRLERLSRPAETAEWFSIEEFARRVSRSTYSVREWARLGRIRAVKKATGSGPHRPWVISSEELARFQREGLLPSPYKRQGAGGEFAGKERHAPPTS